MNRNVGKIDRIARIVVGATLGLTSLGILAGYVNLAKIYSPALGFAALGLLMTGFMGRCGIYKALGVDTCNVE